MKIKFWGTRGSVATPGEDTVRYGGNTTCIEVRLKDNSLIILDAGTGIRKLGRELIGKQNKNIDIFLTHPHWDHIQGFPFFAPMHMEGYNITVHGWPTTNRKVQNTITVQMEGTYFPVDFSQLSANINFNEISGLSLPLRHARLSFCRCNHPVICHSIKIQEDDKTFVFMTDNELEAENKLTPWEGFVDFCGGVDMLVHDAQFTPQELKQRMGWGHSSYVKVLQLAKEARVKILGLFHHDPDHGDDFIDFMLEDCKKRILQENLQLDCFAAQEGMEIPL